MKKTTKRIRSRLKIVGATATAVFSLFSVFTATYAWFSSNTSADTTGMQIKVQTIPGIEYGLYYLDHFGTPGQSGFKDGNYNTEYEIYSGYYGSAANSSFVLIDSEDDTPTNISNLWPAHRLTFALIITKGNLNSFSLVSWDETTNNEIKIDAETNISLSWAINIYGKAYDDIPKQANDQLTVAYGFDHSYKDEVLSDVFTYVEDGSTDPELPKKIDDVTLAEDEDEQTIVYFSIEFDNSDETFYSFDGTYYFQDDDGDSNCYKGLSLTDLTFKLA